MINARMSALGAATAVILAMGGGIAARADVSYTLTGRLNGIDPGAQPDLKTTLSFQGSKTRSDSTIGIHGQKLNIVNVVDCDAGKVYTLDAGRKIYTVVDAAGLAPVPFGMATLLPGYSEGGHSFLLPLPQVVPPSPSGGAPTESVTVTDQGMQKVGRTNAHHWTVTWDNATPALPTSQTANVWTDDSATQPLDCAVSRWLSGTGGSYTGDTASLRTVLSAVPVRIEVSAGGPSVVTYERTKMSTDSVDAQAFQMPKDARQVTPQEFSDAERASIQAMMSHRSNAAPAGSNIPGAQAAESNGANQPSISGMPGTSPTVSPGYGK